MGSLSSKEKYYIEQFTKDHSIFTGMVNEYEKDGYRLCVKIFRHTYSSVLCVLSSPEGQKSVAIKPTKGDFPDIVYDYPEVQTYFPKVEFSIHVHQKQAGLLPEAKHIVVSQQVEGYDIFGTKDNARAYELLLSDPKIHKKMMTTFAKICDLLLQFPIELRDIDPTTGKNFFYNTEKKKFHLIDTDTVRWKYEQAPIAKAISYIHHFQQSNKLTKMYSKLAYVLLSHMHKQYPRNKMRYEEHGCVYALTSDAQKAVEKHDYLFLEWIFMNKQLITRIK